MPIYLDLLPPDRKNEIKRKKNLKRAIFQEIRLLVPAAFFLAVIFSLNASLGIQLDSLQESYSLENSQKDYQELKSYENKFMEVNAKVVKASNFQSKHLYWSRILAELSRILPEKIQITNFSTADYALILSGKAKTREDLLAFQEKIRSAGCFSGVDIPLSNLVSREDLVFQASLTVNPDCLRPK